LTDLKCPRCGKEGKYIIEDDNICWCPSCMKIWDNYDEVGA